MNIEKVKIAVIGQGYVGLPLAIEFGKKYPTLGFDINVGRIAELNKDQNEYIGLKVEGTLNPEYYRY